MDDIFGCRIGGSCLRTEEYRHGSFRFIAGFDPVVHVYRTEQVQLLSLVFMETLDLYVEDGIGTDFNASFLPQILAEAALP